MAWKCQILIDPFVISYRISKGHECFQEIARWKYDLPHQVVYGY